MTGGVVVSASVFPSQLVRVGFGREPTFGVPVAAAALLPVAAPTVGDGNHLIPDVSWRENSNASHGQAPGQLSSQVGLSGPLLVGSVGWPLLGVLGSDDVSGAGPYAHVFTALNSGDRQPGSFTVVSADPVGALAWPGCQVTQVTLTCPSADGLLSWAATLTGLSGVAASRPTAVLDSSTPLQGWLGGITVDGVAANYFSDFEVQLTRTVTPKWTTDGTRGPGYQHAGLLAVSGKATVVLPSDVLRRNYVAGSVLSIVGSWVNGAGSQGVTVQSSTCVLTQAVRSYGSRWIEMDLAWVADDNTTDAGSSGGLSPVKVTLINSVSSY